jgi:penicillin-binding protein 1B
VVTRRRRWLRPALLGLGVLALLTLAVGGSYWQRYARIIDARLAGEQRPDPRIFGRPFELAAGRGLAPAQLVLRLNEVGYSERPDADEPGEFSVSADAVLMVPRTRDDDEAAPVRVEFSRGSTPVIRRLVNTRSNRPVRRILLDPPLLAALAPGEKRRTVPLSRIPQHLVHAVLAIEDRRFYDHGGVDPIRAVGALISNLRGDRPYLEGASTLTQQIVKNTFLTPDKTLRRKLQEQFMAVVLESRLTKDQILDLYLNDVVLGQRGPFAIHGMAEASRIFFAKDVSSVSLAEAATLAGLAQSPSRLNPFRYPDRASERRNVVLSAMVEAGFVGADAAREASTVPMKVSPRALEDEAPYFVDYVSQLVDERFAGLLQQDAAVDVHTTLDVHLQRLAQEAIGEGVARIDKQLEGRGKGMVQAALVALDPRTGDILAMVGGRSYSQSQYNRVTVSRRQPGSIFKPFVYLAAFERALEEGWTWMTPATIVLDEPTVFKDGEEDYMPANYQNEYDGPVTLRRALAMSRNNATIKVAEATGYDYVANVWSRVGLGTPARPYPSIALGVFEASPLEMATAYTVFAGGGQLRPARAITRIVENGESRAVPVSATRTVARADTTFLVTNMMRSVLNEGTGAGARAAGFALDAAGKSGTTNELRDAWFAGFTPELITVVWVGLDDNQPLGLGGAQAALPIWTSFMKSALIGRPNVPFAVPDAIVLADIDRDSGQLATPWCPRVFREAFVFGTEPLEACSLHGGNRVTRWFRRFGGAVRRIIR